MRKSKRYGITNMIIGQQPFIKLSVAEYEKIKTALNNLEEALNIEEKFNLVMENYAEYERELLTLATDAMVFKDYTWAGLQTEKHAINRRLINLLTTCRLYMDQMPHSLNILYGKRSTQAKELKKKMSEQYDGNVEYRIMEALRNYVQHRDLPITQISRLSWWDGGDNILPGEKMKFAMQPNLLVSKLKEGKTFKAKTLAELEKMGKEVDIRPIVRKYMDSIGGIQEFIRSQIKDDVAAWRALEAATEKRYRSRKKESHGIAIVIKDETDMVSESHYTTQNMAKRYDWLIGRNSMFRNYVKSVVTNEIQGK